MHAQYRHLWDFIRGYLPDNSMRSSVTGNVNPDISEGDLQDAFAGCGEVSKVKKVEARSCAFVTFATRADAESAAEKMQNKLIVKGIRLKLMWGRPQERRAEPDSDAVVNSSIMNPLHTCVAIRNFSWYQCFLYIYLLAATFWQRR